MEGRCHMARNWGLNKLFPLCVEEKDLDSVPDQQTSWELYCGLRWATGRWVTPSECYAYNLKKQWQSKESIVKISKSYEKLKLNNNNLCFELYCLKKTVFLFLTCRVLQRSRCSTSGRPTEGKPLSKRIGFLAFSFINKQHQPGHGRGVFFFYIVHMTVALEYLRSTLFDQTALCSSLCIPVQLKLGLCSRHPCVHVTSQSASRFPYPTSCP